MARRQSFFVSGAVEIRKTIRKAKELHNEVKRINEEKVKGI